MLFHAVRRKVSLMMVFALLLSTLMPRMAFGEATQFKDIADSYAQKEIQSLVEAGIISGYEDNTFKPNKAMTRAELAKIIVLALGLKENGDKAAPFKDVDPNSWYRGYVSALVETGITEGTSATTFSPNSNVTREELVVFFIRAFKLEDTAKKLPVDTKLSDISEVSEWAKAQVSLAFKNGFINGVEGSDGTLKFKPKDHAERQALARLAYEFKTNKSVYVDKSKELLAEEANKGQTPVGTPAATQVTTDRGTSPATPAPATPAPATPAPATPVPATPAPATPTPATPTPAPTAPAPVNGLQVVVKGESTDSIYADEPTEVIFRVALNEAETVNASVYKVDDTGKVISEITSLYDDGLGAHGDSLQADGIYSGKATLTESTEGYINLQAYTGDAPSSTVFKLSVVKHLTDEQLAQTEIIENNTQDKLDQLVTEYGDLQKAKEETVAWLQAQAEVQYAGISGAGGSIWYLLDTGILGGISAAPENTKGLSSTGEAAPSDALKTNTLTQSVEQTVSSIGSKRVAVISPFASELTSSTVYDAVYDKFNQSDYPFLVERVKDTAADVNFFKGLNNYGVVVLDTHGDTFYDENVLQMLHNTYGIDFKYAGPQVMFLTGEKATVESKKAYELDLKKGRLAIISGYYAITPSFITRYNDMLPDTIVFNGSCRSLYNNSMADAFINNGAATYYGYTDYVKLAYDQAIIQSVFTALVDENKTTEEAFNSAVAANGANDGLATFAMKGSSIDAKTKGLINGTFETGNWIGWNGNGDVRVISKLGPLKPTEGNYMAIISTGLGFENNDYAGFDYNSDSYIEQNFIIPAGVTTLSFDYNFISEEPKEYVGTKFNDTFKTTVTSSVYINTASVVTSHVNGGDTVTSSVYGNESVTIGTESINGSTVYWIDENKVAIDFYGGDKTTYMTNWKHVQFDVSQFAGKASIVLRFHVWDQGDSAFDTAVLIDNVILK
ncbi:S-layer homology domain-containing protein [Paenibacillus rhizophilus]|uniref:S-layer homology domain-containing protein n=1 Tax=Paenibacillus rhizophilus TaxID=1850366 RepID=A0A3N9NX75_9BACL|nr:S-layer homology domain-containing protein [Paenibacillus rhizophilus]RQW07907.1 S-layer homology domain-containing protein [Paenibacillus rhizophilus]